jgi:lysozyme
MGDQMADLRIAGLDVSKFQPSVDWAKVKAAGMQFVFARASFGVDAQTETTFKAHWQGAKAAGLIRGAYHFFVPADDAGAQARLFLAQMRSALAPGENAYLPAVIDVEMQPGSVSIANYVAGIRAWITAVEADPLFAGRRTILYTTASFWATLGNPAGFTDHPLWVADYGQDPPRMPKGWASYAFFQKSQDGTVDGIAGKIDADFFNGDSDVLTAMTAPLTP